MSAELAIPAAVFLDRDGVLIDAGIEGSSPPHRAASIALLPGVSEALDRLRSSGFVLIVVTNQPDIARGRSTITAVGHVHRALARALRLEHFEVCPHDNDDRCPCRKPAPGLLLGAAARLGVDLERSWMVGDRWVDIGAGKAAGVRTVLLERPYSWRANSSGPPPRDLAPAVVATDLLEAAAIIAHDQRR